MLGWGEWGPEKRSIGIAQLRIDNVRNWNLLLPSWNAGNANNVPAWKIRSALMDPELSTDLLAQAVARIAANGPTPQAAVALGLPVGPFSFAGWNARPVDERARIAALFAGGKDDIQARMTGGPMSPGAGDLYRKVTGGLLAGL